MDYDFKPLSPYQFEQLTRDLLKAEQGVNFELFKSGKDGGVDLRHIDALGQTTIVQCKHYAGSTISNLISKLRINEAPKLEALAPYRYLLVTSLALSSHNKDQIIEVLSPHITQPNHILGNEELNSLLRDHSSIERTYFNLWACSLPVMQKVMHAKIFNYTDAQMEELKTRLCFMVKSPSFSDAVDILSTQKFCIIAGGPGIGKTTLAEILLIEYLEEGYEAIRISADISEAFQVLDASRKQVFYYDDFLGQTGLDQKLSKNEDQRIVDFCTACKRSNNSLFILTTREYILNQAKSTYEKLASAGIDSTKCVIDASKYSLIDRAEILYNHLYFSGVPEEFLASIRQDENFLKIIQHQSFNPRVIESIVKPSFIKSIKPEQYVDDIIEYLDHPHQLWDHAYKSQLSEVARHLLVVLVSTPPTIYLKHFTDLFLSYRETYCLKYGGSRSPSELRNALKECEGNFVTISLENSDQFISFQNPSVRDYLTFFTSSEISYIEVLLESTQSFSQYIALWNTYEPLIENPLREHAYLNILFQNGMARSLETRSITTSFVVTLPSTEKRRMLVHQSMISRCQFILNLPITPTTELRESLVGFLDNYFVAEKLEKGHDWHPIVDFLIKLAKKDRYNYHLSEYLSITATTLSSNLTQLSDYSAAANFCNSFPEECKNLIYEIRRDAEPMKELFDNELGYLGSVDDIPALEECISDVEIIESAFAFDLNDFKARVQDDIQQLYDQAEEEGEDTPTLSVYKRKRKLEAEAISDVRLIFQTL